MARKTGPKPNGNAVKIQYHIKSGKSIRQVARLGYSEETVKYYWFKIKNPEYFEKRKKQIQKYNKRKTLTK